MKRSKQNLSHYRMHTLDMGQLVPISCVPVLPGDTIQHRTSALIRLAPLNTPVMHPVAARIHHFFVPNRIVWPESENGGWEQFITGGPDGNNSEVPPFIGTRDNNDTWLNYLGIPQTTLPGINVNALPLRAANMIFNEYYRDQDLGTTREPDDWTIPNIAWEKDYFTTARPWAQKGPDISLPVTAGDVDVHARAGIGGVVGIYSDDEADYHRLNTTSNDLEVDPASLPDGTASMYIPQDVFSQINVNEFRAGFALQRYQEARARYGSRFTEYLRYLGITPSDARLQRPEYLGGGSSRLSFSEVLQTAPGEVDEAGVGDLYGHGIAGVRSNAYRKFFEEHGYIISMLSVRPKAIYQNGVHREFLKSTKEDYFQKELANLGQQDVMLGEVYLDQADYLDSFGFQDRYDEYRMHPSWIGGDFTTTLNSWHLGRELDDSVTLNEDFINCVPSKRIYQVEDGDSLWAMINHKIVARRLVPKRAYPRIL